MAEIRCCGDGDLDAARRDLWTGAHRIGSALRWGLGVRTTAAAMLADAAEGLSLVWRERVLRALTAAAATSRFFGGFYAAYDPQGKVVKKDSDMYLALDALDQQFALIECAGVLHHLEDPLAGWRELLRPRWGGGPRGERSFRFSSGAGAAYAGQLLVLRDWRRTLGVAA